MDMTRQPEAGGQRAVLNAQDTGIGNHLCSPPPALVCRIANTVALAHSVSEKSSHDTTNYRESFLKNQNVTISRQDHTVKDG